MMKQFDHNFATMKHYMRLANECTRDASACETFNELIKCMKSADYWISCAHIEYEKTKKMAVSTNSISLEGH